MEAAQLKSVRAPISFNESPSWATLNGLGEHGRPAAADASGEVTVNALLRYLSEEVPALDEKYAGSRQDVVQASTGED